MAKRGKMRQNAAKCGKMRQNAAKCGKMRQNTAKNGKIRQNTAKMAKYDKMWQFTVMFGKKVAAYGKILAKMPKSFQNNVQF